MAQVGVKNGKLQLFYPSDAPPRITQQDRERVQVLRGGLKHTLLPRGLILLQDIGIQRKDVFILVVDNDRTSVACMIAAMELECVCLVTSTSRIGLLQHAQEQTGITKVVVVNDASDAVELQQDSAPSANGVQLSWLDESAIAVGGCVCMLTSGSIGAPKVVACTWSRMLLQGQSTQEQLFPSGPARIVCATSISHAYSINALFTLFTSPHDDQSELCFVPTIAGLHSLLTEPKEKFTLLYGTPATYTALLDLPAAAMNVDVPYCAGTRMQLELFHQVYKHCGLQVMQNYGSTETGDIAAWSLFGKTFDDEKLEADVNSGCIYTGSLWPGVTAEIESTGEVLIATPWQALGYIRERALQGFHGRPHRTADVGFMKQDQRGIECLWLQDRLRPSIHAVSAGVTSSHAPKQIEDTVTTHPDVTDALVLMQQGTPNKGGDHEAADTQPPPVRVRAVLKDDAVVRVEDLIEWCAQKYPDLRDSLSVEFVHCLPCSPAGKLMYA